YEVQTQTMKSLCSYFETERESKEEEKREREREGESEREGEREREILRVCLGIVERGEALSLFHESLAALLRLISILIERIEEREREGEREREREKNERVSVAIDSLSSTLSLWPCIKRVREKVRGEGRTESLKFL